MEFIVIWLLVSIEKIAAVLALSGGIMWWCVLIYVLTYVGSLVLSDGKEKLKLNLTRTSKTRKLVVATWIICGVLSVVGALLPSKKEMAVIVGGGITYQVVTSDEAKEFGGKAVELIMQSVDKALEGDIKETAKGALNAL